MKKRNALLTTVTLLLCLVLLCGCQRKPKMIVGELSDLNVRDDLGITLTVKPETLTATRGDFVLQNTSDIDYGYGDSFYVEILTQDGWKQLEADTISHLLMYYASPDETITFEYGWEHKYGKLPAGDYRLLKEILPPDFPENKDSFYISCEFTIE